MEPDRRVRQAIRQVFRKFAERRSARQVLLWFRTERLSLPNNCWRRIGVADA
jgi:hypothetical protein